MTNVPVLDVGITGMVPGPDIPDVADGPGPRDTVDTGD